MWLILYLIICKYRPVATHEITTQHTMSTFPEATRHIFFHRQVNQVVRKPHLKQFHGAVLHHYRRTAHHSHRIWQVYVDVIEQNRGHAYMFIPILVGKIHSTQRTEILYPV
jgi:hypothetical protein